MKSTIERRRILLELLSVRKREKIENLANELDVSVRTIRYDIEILSCTYPKNGKNLRTMIVCDEAHLFIDAKFPIALDFFFSMSKRIRKYNGSFIPATQNIADWNANEELRGKTSAILKNSQYTFIFKLSAPDMKDVLDVYKAGDSFNEEEQRMIISAVTGQVFFIGSSELRTCVKITSGELAMSLFDENKKGG